MTPIMHQMKQRVRLPHDLAVRQLSSVAARERSLCPGEPIEKGIVCSAWQVVLVDVRLAEGVKALESNTTGHQ
jgi:hypothetical protein